MFLVLPLLLILRGAGPCLCDTEGSPVLTLSTETHLHMSVEPYGFLYHLSLSRLFPYEMDKSYTHSITHTCSHSIF